MWPFPHVPVATATSNPSLAEYIPARTFARSCMPPWSLWLTQACFGPSLSPLQPQPASVSRCVLKRLLKSIKLQILARTTRRTTRTFFASDGPSIRTRFSQVFVMHGLRPLTPTRTRNNIFASIAHSLQLKKNKKNTTTAVKRKITRFIFVLSKPVSKNT